MKITKLKCNVTDPTFAEFKVCRVKAESRDLQYITFYINYLKLPINELSVYIIGILLTILNNN